MLQYIQQCLHVNSGITEQDEIDGSSLKKSSEYLSSLINVDGMTGKHR